MRYQLARAAAGAAAAAVLFGGLAGCKSDSSFSKDELQQIKEGPPKQMPSQGQALMQQMNQGGNQGAPPRPAGQPGPGGPVMGAPGPAGGPAGGPGRPVGQPGPAGPGGMGR